MANAVAKSLVQRGFGIDVSVTDILAGSARVGGALAVAATTGRRQNLSRLQARAETGGMGTLGRKVAQFVAWLRSDGTENL